jgi:hypothetical protein
MAVISYWTGDNTTADAVGSNHARLVSGASYAAGQVGQAFKFDGVNDRLQVADSPSFALTGSMTIEAWVKADSVTPSGGPGSLQVSGGIVTLTTGTSAGSGGVIGNAGSTTNSSMKRTAMAATTFLLAVLVPTCSLFPPTTR